MTVEKKQGTPHQERQHRHMIDEADIGSGEKTPGELETERMVRQVPEKNSSKQKEDSNSGQTP